MFCCPAAQFADRYSAEFINADIEQCDHIQLARSDAGFVAVRINFLIGFGKVTVEHHFSVENCIFLHGFSFSC